MEANEEMSQKLEGIQTQVDGIIGKIPFFNGLVDKIDSRSLFTNGMSLFLRLIAGLLLIVGTLVLLMATFEALTVERGGFGGAIKFFAAVVDLSMLVVLAGSVVIILKRAGQVQVLEHASVIDIALVVLRVVIETSILYFAFVMLITGFLTSLLGTDAAQVMYLSTGYSIPQAISTITPTGDSAFWVRIGGLFTIIGSAFVGFFGLFLGYVGHDLLNILYKFFVRK